MNSFYFPPYIYHNYNRTEEHCRRKWDTTETRLADSKSRKCGWKISPEWQKNFSGATSRANRRSIFVSSRPREIRNNEHLIARVTQLTLIDSDFKAVYRCCTPNSLPLVRDLDVKARSRRRPRNKRNDARSWRGRGAIPQFLLPFTAQAFKARF